jgi:hypothetical protein
MPKDAMFKCVVENAIDFLKKSITELDEYPKYSMINFHASVEIFIKARLMAEHWTLVVSKRQEPNWNKFVSGDFQSVTLADAASRLSNIIQSGLSKSELDIFQEVTNHRNKMVHFYHEAHSDKKNQQMKQDVVRTQLKAWYILHRLITERWKDTFLPWTNEIGNIDKELRKYHDFLAVIFENFKNNIEVLKKQGYMFASCPSCRFEAQKHDNEKGTIYYSECLVCGLQEKNLQIECPDCKITVVFADEGRGDCSKCGRSFTPDDLSAMLIDEGGAYEAAKEGDPTAYAANCGDCEGYHTVILTENEEYICVNCLNTFDSLNYCEWCNEANTGDMESSYWAGCSVCEGKSGWDSDED